MIDGSLCWERWMLRPSQGVLLGKPSVHLRAIKSLLDSLLPPFPALSVPCTNSCLSVGYSSIYPGEF
uniref:Uncharacterized protein n=1 Tax=Rhizophora mucronata TaxID=61149 RepID=A0A2P2QPD6_RHIMU